MASVPARPITGLVWRREPRSSGAYLAPVPAPKAPIPVGKYQRAAAGGNRAASAGLRDVPVLDLMDEIAATIQQLRHSTEEKAKLMREQEELKERLQEAPDGEWKCLKCVSTNWVDRPCCKRCGELRADMDLLRRVQNLKSRERRLLQEGRGGGFFDRQAVEKKAWNSDDEELDEFGRRKRRRRCSGEAVPRASGEPRPARP
mmetsp:Transcript_44388/g.102542  ORF Transcript_44388/g.102542 Transcript_44388/m.102542 type:complete len:202 (+) Transcript_44388:50-655(+)